MATPRLRMRVAGGRSLSFIRPVLAAGCLLLSGVGTRVPAAKAAEPPRQRQGKAWIDAKSAVIFPLASREVPKNREQLKTAMTNGWNRALKLPNPDDVVKVEGGRYPAVETLKID